MIYLIDASVFVFRAWFSIPSSMTGPDGSPVNAAYGFARFLGDFLSQTRPGYVAVAFDESLTTSFRNEIFPDYKANRELPPPELESQFRDCRAITAALGLAEFADPRFEADDIIGTIAARMRSAGQSCVVVSRDKDLAQLLRVHDEYWNYIDRRRFGYSDVAGHFGAVPERMPDYQALVGDKVDNIPGVPGVGPKTATALMQEFVSLEELFDNLDQVQHLPIRGAAGIAKRLDQHRDAAFLARRLTRIETTMPLEMDEDRLVTTRPDLKKLFSIYDRLGFGEGVRRQAQELTDIF